MQEPSFLKKIYRKIVSFVCFVSEYIGNIVSFLDITFVSFLDNIVNSVEPPYSVEYTCSMYHKISFSLKNRS